MTSITWYQMVALMRYIIACVMCAHGFKTVYVFIEFPVAETLRALLKLQTD